jgi:hypothetical protein
LSGLQHLETKATNSWQRIMNEYTPVRYLVQDQSFSKDNYWWRYDPFPAVVRDAAHLLEYNTGPASPPPVPPTIGSLTAVADSYGRPGLRLETHDVHDVDGRVRIVEFYYDRNGNSVLDIGLDEYLSYDASPSRWRGYAETGSYPRGSPLAAARQCTLIRA